MTEQEARQILGASMDTSWEEVLKVRYAGIVLIFVTSKEI